MKKLAIFYTIFFAVHLGAVLASKCCDSAKIPMARGLARKHKKQERGRALVRPLPVKSSLLPVTPSSGSDSDNEELRRPPR